MRHDGEVTYYSIERLLQKLETKEKKYYDCGNMEMYHETLPHDVINEFTACGECWQKYGYHGTLSYNTAISIMDKLRDEILNDDTKNIEMTSRHFPDGQKPWSKILDFRVVEHKMTQETTYYERVSDIDPKLQTKDDIVTWLSTTINELNSKSDNINRQVQAIYDDPTSDVVTADLLIDRDNIEKQSSIYESMLDRIEK